MKRIALCLYGKFNNRLSATSGVDGFKYIREKILENHYVDVFIHSWDLENQQQILGLYKPWIKQSLFEQQKDFTSDIKTAGIVEEDFRAPGGESFRTLGNSLSFFYSRAQSLLEKKTYEESNKFKYDVVVCSRFDLGQMDRYNGFQDHKVSEIPFDENLDMSYLYSAMWYQFNEGFTDMWFYSSSDIMDTFIEMYPRALKYYRKDSSYVAALTQGWPDSNSQDIFSNEIFKSPSEKTVNRMTYSYHEAQNNHFLHKWFLIDTGLYQRCRFLPTLATRFCKLIYSESAESLKKYIEKCNLFSKVMGPQLVLVPKGFQGSYSGYEYIYYDLSLSYVERLSLGLQCVKQRGFEAILFEHDTSILVGPVDYYHLKSSISMVLKARWGKPLRNGFDYLSLRGALGLPSVGTWSLKHVRWVPRIFFYSMFIQPSVWRVSSLANVLSEMTKGSYHQLNKRLWLLSLRFKFKCGVVRSISALKEIYPVRPSEKVISEKREI